MTSLLTTASSYCKVNNCRYKFTHTTRSHKCGKCNNYGHGIIECNNPYKTFELSKYNNEIIDTNNQCTVIGCVYKNFHKTEAHNCPICNIRTTHSINECPNNETKKTIQCPICIVNNIIKGSPIELFNTDIVKCCICFEETNLILLPYCNHVCLCKKCFEKIDT